ncbi:response regulator [Anabaena cylindrica FACHB-243]|uniref:Response regulator receiver protein n=1 Tax=Anabaena cylindrica (strain ATCC 27899 / PCC 7122) TaxID=272123 RepID=K9ZDV2_ANACC|nr:MULTISPECIES: response regulator [Anabaena]AFZ57361.1 response regulator receiver protein [Anabaena cylindrica PCC 7122]MBD2421042.1 response regulator [Anabaena cylindrica FACHB-243]MBY5280746.1 response regulator [Anabaena sp. CCAP 1446/1C]MBY5306387.1 response regulator [Anabaena sp. CCAP 1446/1C]MCM2405794.1 response regulator [Anabaena sp. CCAP 1446/1C]
MYLTHSFMSDEKKQSSQPPLILVVEDHDDSLLLLSYALELLGCRFICQSDSSTTLLVAKEYQPDLILLDILLPSLNGLDVARYLKREPLTCNIPVVAVTALAGREHQERILRAGFNDYISKPYLLEDLEAIICRLLDDKIEPYLEFEVCQEN